MDEDDFPVVKRVTQKPKRKTTKSVPAKQAAPPPAVQNDGYPNDTSNLRELFRACFAEFLAMLMFVFLGCGSVAATGEFLVDDADLSVKVNVARVLPIATAFGLSITVLAFNTSAVSGGHINPAVTFAFYLQKKLSAGRAVLYIISQFLGSLLGAAILWGGIASASYIPTPGTTFNGTNFILGVSVVPAVGNPPFYLGANQLNPVISTSNGVLLEIMGTGFLVGTVFSTALDKRTLGANSNLAPIPIGLSVWICHLVLIPWTGCGINPARTFGPAMVNSFAGVNTWGDANLVIYFLGPMLGASLAVLVMHFLWGGFNPPEPISSAEVVDEEDEEVV